MSEAIPRPTVEGVQDDILRLGERVAEESVLIGSSAVYLAMPEHARPPHDRDIVTTEGVYRSFRGRPGWEEIYAQDGRRLLSNGFYDLEVDPKVGALSGLRARSWLSGGVHVASIQDMVARKQTRNSEKDQQDVACIRSRLLDPTLPPLPMHLMQYELEAMRETLPQDGHESPEANGLLRLAANGLFVISALYGDARIGRANQIVGALELPEYQVAATYHNGFDLMEEIRLLQQDLRTKDVSPLGQRRAQAAMACGDIHYGNGRKKRNAQFPCDERMSANLLVAHAQLLLGPDKERDDQLEALVMGSAYNEETHQQPGKFSDDPLVRSMTSNDLHLALSGIESAELAFDIIAENGMSARFSPKRILGRLMIVHGVRVASTMDAMLFIDEHPNERLDEDPATPTAKEYLIGGLRSSADFRDPDPDTGVQPSHDWTLDNVELRRRHSQKLRQLAELLETNQISATEALQLAKAHTIKLRLAHAA